MTLVRVRRPAKQLAVILTGGVGAVRLPVSISTRAWHVTDIHGMERGRTQNRCVIILVNATIGETAHALSQRARSVSKAGALSD